MWTTESRAFVGDLGAGQALGDEQFALLEPMIPHPEEVDHPPVPGQASRSSTAAYWLGFDPPAGGQPAGVSQLRSDCPSSTTAGTVGGSAQAQRESGEAAAVAGAGPCPPAGGSKPSQ